MKTFNSKHSDQGFKNLDASEFESRILKDPETVILDVRTEDEYLSGHIPGAINLNVTDPSFTSEIEKLNKMKSYYVYCRGGGRSISACHLLAEDGFLKIYNLGGGIMSYNGKIE
jgi:rhodanese-related sulfurtransferase